MCMRSTGPTHLSIFWRSTGKRDTDTMPSEDAERAAELDPRFDMMDAAGVTRSRHGSRNVGVNLADGIQTRVVSRRN